MPELAAVASAETADIRLARAIRTLGPSALRDILPLVSRPGVISFGVGVPGTDLLPARELAAAAAALLPERPATLQYGMPHAELKASIVGLMAERGVACSAEQVFLTSGSQQAMELLTHLLLDPGGELLLEEVTYEGIRLAVASLAPAVHAVPTDPRHGIDVEAVAAALAAGMRPAYLYVIPEGHNPMGGSLSDVSRRRLVELARRYRVPILEDDTYGHLQYTERPRPAMRSLDDRWVIYLGSLSKVLAPALRVGWAVVPEELVERLTTLKHASDIDTATLGQRLAGAFMAAGELPAHLGRLRAAYGQRRAAMLDALDRHMPPGVAWSRPESGFYVWMELPEGIDTMELLLSAVEEQRVAFSPGIAFAAPGRADHCLRLSYAAAGPETIEEGVARLARALRGRL